MKITPFDRIFVRWKKDERVIDEMKKKAMMEGNLCIKTNNNNNIEKA